LNLSNVYSKKKDCGYRFDRKKKYHRTPNGSSITRLCRMNERVQMSWSMDLERVYSYEFCITQFILSAVSVTFEAPIHYSKTSTSGRAPLYNENLVIMSVFEWSEKSISGGNGTLESEHLLIMNAFEWVPIVPALERFYCIYFSVLVRVSIHFWMLKLTFFIHKTSNDWHVFFFFIPISQSWSWESCALFESTKIYFKSFVRNN